MHVFARKPWSALALILWMSVIFAFSSVPGGTPSAEMPLTYFLERKGAHVFEYFVLLLLIYNVLRAYSSYDHFGLKLALAGPLSLLYAFSDEVHQLVVPGREGKLADVGIDAIGIALGLIVIALMSEKKKIKKRKTTKKKMNPKKAKDPLKK
ncbi:MAG: VanZ family protein [Candidatus Moraniibacteriota bacterium]